MCARRASAFFFPWPIVFDPVGDCRRVALRGPALRFLVAPTHLAQEATDVVAVVADSELALDNLRNTGRGPQVGSVAGSDRPLQGSSRGIVSACR